MTHEVKYINPLHFGVPNRRVNSAGQANYFSHGVALSRRPDNR
jgi:hypothetical protein